MITIDLGTIEHYDSEKNEFTTETGGIVNFEYSLKAMYEWEGRWSKSFLKGDYSDEELMDFYKTMALTPFDDKFLSTEVTQMLADYISKGNTATTFSSNGSGGGTVSKPKLYTAEEIYALMFMSSIPLDRLAIPSFAILSKADLGLRLDTSLSHFVAFSNPPLLSKVTFTLSPLSL